MVTPSFYSELRRFAEKPFDLVSSTLRHLRAAPAKRITVAARADENRVDKIIALAQIARGPLLRICRNQCVAMFGKSEVSETAKAQSLSCPIGDRTKRRLVRRCADAIDEFLKSIFNSPHFWAFRRCFDAPPAPRSGNRLHNPLKTAANLRMVSVIMMRRFCERV